jgi:hypothetical protein
MKSQYQIQNDNNQTQRPKMGSAPSSASWGPMTAAATLKVTTATETEVTGHPFKTGVTPGNQL